MPAAIAFDIIPHRNMTSVLFRLAQVETANFSGGVDGTRVESQPISGAVPFVSADSAWALSGALLGSADRE